LIRITVQIGDEESDERQTVISSSFENFDEVEHTNFIKKVKMFDDNEECSECSKKKKKSKMGFDTNKKCKTVVIEDDIVE
jgi:hypothetical protein